MVFYLIIEEIALMQYNVSVFVKMTVEQIVQHYWSVYFIGSLNDAIIKTEELSCVFCCT